MAGVKGMKGGGGARPGAGRPRKAAKALAMSADDPLEFLIGVMKAEDQDPRLRVRAAIAAAQYKHAKMEGGKKDAKDEAAKQAGKGKFASSAPPKLSIVS